MRETLHEKDARFSFFFTKNVETIFVELERDRLRSAKNGHDRFLQT